MTDPIRDRAQKRSLFALIGSLPGLIIDLVTSELEQLKSELVTKLKHAGIGIGLMLVAGVAGAGLAWTRPWRWIFRSALFAGLVPQLVARFASSLPIESWMSMVGASMSQRRPARAAQAEAPPG